MEKKKDLADELLRIFYLEASSDETGKKELERIMNRGATVEMSAAKKEELFERLCAIDSCNSLGIVIATRLKELSIEPEEISKNSLLPISVLKDLLEDKIYTNNVPIMFFKNLLKQLGISFQLAEKSILKTFALLHEKTIMYGTAGVVNPSFRKGTYIIDTTNKDAHAKSDGRELYENKEALDKYLTRLNELLID